jgi:hypothetical protein
LLIEATDSAGVIGTDRGHRFRRCHRDCCRVRRIVDCGSRDASRSDL